MKGKVIKASTAVLFIVNIVIAAASPALADPLPDSKCGCDPPGYGIPYCGFGDLDFCVNEFDCTSC